MFKLQQSSNPLAKKITQLEVLWSSDSSNSLFWHQWKIQPKGHRFCSRWTDASPTPAMPTNNMASKLHEAQSGSERAVPPNSAASHSLRCRKSQTRDRSRLAKGKDEFLPGQICTMSPDLHHGPDSGPRKAWECPTMVGKSCLHLSWQQPECRST